MERFDFEEWHEEYLKFYFASLCRDFLLVTSSTSFVASSRILSLFSALSPHANLCLMPHELTSRTRKKGKSSPKSFADAHRTNGCRKFVYLIHANVLFVPNGILSFPRDENWFRFALVRVSVCRIGATLRTRMNGNGRRVCVCVCCEPNKRRNNARMKYLCANIYEQDVYMYPSNRYSWAPAMRT